MDVVIGVLAIIVLIYSYIYRESPNYSHQLTQIILDARSGGILDLSTQNQSSTKPKGENTKSMLLLGFINEVGDIPSISAHID